MLILHMEITQNKLVIKGGSFMQRQKLLAIAMAFMMSLSLFGSTMDVHAAEIVLKQD